jgi:hypothetical protein
MSRVLIRCFPHGDAAGVKRPQLIEQTVDEGWPFSTGV